jgi:hypothetical protein
MQAALRSWKRRWTVECEQMPVSPMPPLATGAEDEEDGVQCLAVDDPGIVAAQGMDRTRRQERLDPVPGGVGDAPLIVADGWESGIRVGPDLVHKEDPLGRNQVPGRSTLTY